MATITIFGYGSLMSASSAARTMPQAGKFRPAILSNYIRMYNLVSISGIRRGISNEATKEMAALAISPKNGEFVNGVLFNIPGDQLEPYLEREHRYRAVEVSVYDEVAKCEIQAWTVVEQTDDDYRQSMTEGDVEWEMRVGQYYQGVLWGREDILPISEYMIDTLIAAYELGGLKWFDNMLDATFLADKVTSLRTYLLKRISDPADNMYECLDSVTMKNDTHLVLLRDKLYSSEEA